MKRILNYVILPLLLLAISPGLETMQMLVAEGRPLGQAWIMFIPSSVIYFCVAVILNNRYLIPKFLYRGKFTVYLVWSSGLIAMVALLVSIIEMYLRGALHLPGRLEGWTMGWQAADVLSNVIFWVPLMTCLSLPDLYDRWKEDLESERTITDQLSLYMRKVRDSLQPQLIFSRLKGISDVIRHSPAMASDHIEELAEYLRTQLADLPSPPRVTDRKYDPSLFSGLTSLLVGSRFRVLRYLLFFLALVTVSYIAYSYEYVSDFMGSLLASGLLFLYLGIMAVTDILLYRRYAKSGDYQSLIRAIAVMVLLFLSPMLIAFVGSLGGRAIDRGVIGKTVEIAAVAAGIIGIALYIAGLNALLFLQDWIRVQRHITVLRAETIREEYLFLRKQINPHFLFNVLNNIEISTYDEPLLAEELLSDLTDLLRYQFLNSHREWIELSEEVGFLNCYLALEQSRRDEFRYHIEMEESAGNALVPALIFLPVIENAVKYSYGLKDENNLLVEFALEDRWVIFRCRNPYNLETVSRQSHHGIGLVNVRRRLQLIYDGNARMNIDDDGRYYEVELRIPLDKKTDRQNLRWIV